MSSTNRSRVRDTHAFDYYVTPQNEIRLFLTEALRVVPNLLVGKILDPCAGGDSDHQMSYPEVLKEFEATQINTIDIREDSLASLKEDYLQHQCSESYDLIITNPPFSIAQEIIIKALTDCKPDGWVVMLLRLNFFGSQIRKPFFDNFMPEYVFIHNQRMSFGLNKHGKKGTDSIEYMHAMFRKGYKPEFTKLKVI